MNAQKRAKLHATAKKAAWMNNVPEFSVLDYNGSLVKWLNFFNTDVPTKDKQSWVINYWANQDKPTKGLEKLSDTWFSQAAVLVRVKESGYDIESKHEDYLDNKYLELWSKTKQPIIDDLGNEVEQETKVTKGPSIQERLDRQVTAMCSEFDNALDEFCFKGTDFDPKEFLVKNDVKAPVAKRISDHLKTQVVEFEDAYRGKDDQLTEAYSHLGKRGLKKVLDFLRGCIVECNNMAIIARTTRKPRKTKEKPASVVVSKCQYLREFPELKMKSVPAERIIGSSTVILYDTKYRKLISYECVDGATLTIKGTTVNNFDPNKSYSKMVRKPEILDKVQTLSKRPFNALIKGIRAVESKVNGRINNNQIILLVF